MKTRILAPMLFAALLTACAPPATPPSPPASAPAAIATDAPKAVDGAAADSLCVIAGADGWAGCAGKRVEIEGRYPATLAQHPLLAPPAMDGAPPVTQTYLETADGRQLIVLAEGTPTPCAGAMRVRGTLQPVDLGGPEGTPQSYRGWALHGASVSCE